MFFWGTVITCLTGFGIFRHGGFGNPHVLGVVTLIVLPDDPKAQPIIGVFFLIFLVGATLQVLRLRRRSL